MSKRTHRSAAFTLIELLVVVAIIALLIGILLPALGMARDSARKTRALANIKTHGQILAIYANENRGDLLNPFAGPSIRLGVFNVSPPWAAGTWQMRRDGYAYHWGPLAREYYADQKESDVFIAPNDHETLESIERLIADHDINRWVADISYWYSPTMFFNPQRFYGADGGESDNFTTGGGSHQTMLRRNNIDDILYPSQKITILEKQDHGTQAKLLFSHPEASVALISADGAGFFSLNSVIYARIDGHADGDSLKPSGGKWADNWGLQRYNMNNAAAPGKLLEDQQDLYYAFYMWTRRGIHGRDLL